MVSSLSGSPGKRALRHWFYIDRAPRFFFLSSESTAYSGPLSPAISTATATRGQSRGRGACTDMK